MKVSRVTRRGLLLGGGACAAQLALGAACGGATGGKLVTLRTLVRMEDDAQRAFTNDHGWTIQLESALLSRGRLEYFDSEPVEPSRTARRVRDWLVPTAHAHPGHLQEGGMLGEVLGSDVIELANGTTELATGRGMSGVFGTARLAFDPDPMDGTVVELWGSAERDGDVRRFIARASEADVLSQKNEPEVWGCPFEDEPEVVSDGTVTLTVRPTVWLADVRFELHAPHSDGSHARLDPLLEPFSAFVFGVRDHDAYVFSYTPTS